MPQNFDYTVKSPRDFDDVVARIESLIASKGFRVVSQHDMQDTLQKKGFHIEPMKILEICSAEHAYRVISADPRISYMLPCRISVYREGNETVISMLLPSAISMFFEAPGIKNVANEVEEVLRDVVDEAR